MNCPSCKSKRIEKYNNQDLLLVIADMPDVSKLFGYVCQRCQLSFYLHAANVQEKGTGQ